MNTVTHQVISQVNDILFCLQPVDCIPKSLIYTAIKLILLHLESIADPEELNADDTYQGDTDQCDNNIQELGFHASKLTN